MTTFLHYATYPVLGIPAWSLVATLLVLPLVNEIVLRSSAKAQSIYQAVGNALKASPLYAVPVLKQLADIMATPVKAPVVLASVPKSE